MPFRILLVLLAALWLAAPPVLAEKGNRLERIQKKLGLTDPQLEQLKPVFAKQEQRRARWQEFRTSLTAEQQAQLEKGKGVRALGKLKLTAEQQTRLDQLRETRRSEREELQAKLQSVLTPEQLQQLKEGKGKHSGRKRKHSGRKD